MLDMYDDDLKKKISSVEEEVDDEDLQTLLRWSLVGGLVLVWSKPVPIQLLYQQLTHSGNFFHNAAVLIERRYDDETNEEDDDYDKDEMTAQIDGHQ